MKLFKVLLLISLLNIFFADCLIAQEIDSLTAASIINKAIDAYGGKDYLLSIKTLNVEMKTENSEWVIKVMNPNKESIEIFSQNKVISVLKFDGDTGYKISRGHVTQFGEDELRRMKHSKNIFGEFDYIDSSLWKLELIGEGNVRSDQCYKIKATSTLGLVKNLYYSKKTFFLRRTEMVVDPEHKPLMDTNFYNYKKHGRLMRYTSMRIGYDTGFVDFDVERILVNENVSEADFK